MTQTEVSHQSMGEVPVGVPAGALPLTRFINMATTYEVLKAIFSTAPMATNGSAAHRNTAGAPRRDQQHQPKIGDTITREC